MLLAEAVGLNARGSDLSRLSPQAVGVARAAQTARKFTDTGSFTLRCLVRTL